MYKGQEIVDLAEKQLGTRGQAAKSYCGLPSGANYCDAFVTWLFYKTHAAYLFCDGTKQVYCPTTIMLLRKEMPMIPIYLALPGDVIFFDWEPNGNPNHIGVARNRVSDLEIDTVEGNTSGYNTTGVVANKTRTYFIEGTKKVQIQALFRPQFPVSKSEYSTSKKLEIDGLFGFSSIALLQKALKKRGFYAGKIDAILGLGTVKALQEWAGVDRDGSWGPDTSKAIQKKLGVTADGFFGPKSVKALQVWINKAAFSKDESSAESLTHEIGQACLKVAKLMEHAKYHWHSHPDEENCQEEGTCVTFVAVVLQVLGYLKPGQYIWHDGRGYGDGKVYGTNKWMDVIYMHNKPLKKLKKKLKAGDIILLDDNKSGESGSGGHIFILSNKWSGNNPYIWDNSSAKKGKHTYDGDRKVLAVVRLKPKEDSKKTLTFEQKVLHACRDQAEYAKDAVYGWQPDPTIAKSKKKMSCVTYVACVLQRLKILKAGQYIWHEEGGTVYGANSKMTVHYLKGSIKANRDKLKACDIIICGDAKSVEAGGNSHIFIFTGDWDKDGDPIVWDNVSATRTRKGEYGRHGYPASKKIIAVVRLKER